jgi:hypothetical protein
MQEKAPGFYWDRGGFWIKEASQARQCRLR